MDQHVVAGWLWALAGICAIATIYPYTLYPLLLRALPALPVRAQNLRSNQGKEFALLFCAFNEADALPFKLANLRELRMAYPDLALLAYDDCSTDGTADMLEQSGLGIRVVRGAGRTGKAHGMKCLAQLSDREFLVFTDANVELAPEAIHKLFATYADPEVGGVCGLLEYVDVERSATAQTGGLYWRLEELIKTLESRSGNVMGGDGSIFSVRSCLYPEFPDTVLDDMTVSMAVVFAGRRLIKDPLVVAREQLVASKADDFRRRIRISTRSFHTHLWFRPKLRQMRLGDRWRWWSHRYMRWHGGFFLVFGYLCAVVALGMSAHWLAAIALVIATGVVAAAGSNASLGPMSSFIHMFSSILLTGLGVARARQGHTMTTWKPPTR